ncbi:MAG: outer membrane protein assembly factor BamD [Lentisphaeria bacterium]|nr:outer membrane protein assembly factor BamD [Lentisphaeria bacterium]
MRSASHSGFFTVLLSAAVFFSSGLLMADDSEAVKVYAEGHALYESGAYYDAAKKFELVEQLADSPAIKANSLVARIGAWKMCKMIFREFECINSLLTGYPEYSDYKLLSERIYEIGDRYYAGEREPAFWHLRWVPWLNDGDKTIEIYTKALERAPFSPSASRARLRLAYIYDKDGKVKESIVQLKRIISDHPKSEEYKYALLALAEALFISAEKGDGDGRLVQEAYDVLKTYEEKYPSSSEMSWVKRRILQYYDMQAQRLYDMAEYYEKNDRKDASKRYYADILAKYPQSKVSENAEKRLIELDPAFVPDGSVVEKESRLAELRAYKIPEEATRMLISPATDVNTHYLQPVMDLKGPQTRIVPAENKPVTTSENNSEAAK